MPTAIDTHTPTRRSALGFGAAAIAAGLTTPAIAGTSPVAAVDAEIIRVCGQLVSLQQEFATLFGSRTTIAMEQKTEPQLTALCARQARMVKQLERLVPPTTVAGIVATARAALAIWEHTDDTGRPVAEDDGGWLALTCVEWIAAGGAA